MTASDETPSALSAENTNKPQRPINTNKNVKKPDNKKDVECFFCHKRGHVIKYCKKRLKNQGCTGGKKLNHGQDGSHAAFVAESDFSDTIEDKLEDIWTLDSGASRYMTFHREWLQDFSEDNTDVITAGQRKDVRSQRAWDRLHQT